MRCSNSLLSVVLTGACVAALFSGCAKPPELEHAAAKAAFKAAQDIEADKYMANNFANLQSAMEKADGEVANQNQKSPLSRNYKRSIALLKNVTELAGQINAEVPAAKEAIRSQVEKGIPITEAKLKETRIELKKTAKSKEKKDVDKMMADIEQAEVLCGQAAADYKAGNILDASRKLGDSQRCIKKASDKLSCGGVDGLM